VSVNKSKPHIYVIPEDDEDRQLANGFLLGIDVKLSRQIQVLPISGGWIKCFEVARQKYVQHLKNCPHAYLVLLFDFDGQPERREQVQIDFPAEVVDRIFLIGSLAEPKDLRRELGFGLERIGSTLAAECRESRSELWNSPQLAHNSLELERFRTCARQIIFPD